MTGPSLRDESLYKSELEGKSSSTCRTEVGTIAEEDLLLLMTLFVALGNKFVWGAGMCSTRTG
jgi:hypothetical protein